MSTDRPLTLVEVARASDPGRVRHHNEDRALADLPVLAVADGMGGAQAGEVAAEMAVEHIQRLDGEVDSAALRTAIEEANRDIYAAAGDDPQKAGMGTTVTAATLLGGSLEIAHVGDSRGYLWRDGELSQLTDDHSVVAELVRLGKLSPEEAGRHPHRNVITRALGAEPAVAVDVVHQEARPGDVLLLCSDGLTTHLSDDQIAAEMRAGGTLRATADRLVRRANQAGGTDNVTVVLARVGRADRPRRLGPVAAEETARVERPDEKPETTAEMPAVKSLRGQAGPSPSGKSRQPRVLQPVATRRRSRLRPAIVAAFVALALVVGAVAWVASRNYALVDQDGEAVVVHGIPVGILGVDLATDWQGLGISSNAVDAADPGALDDTTGGQGATVEKAARLVWAAGLPDAPPIAGAAPAPGTGTETTPGTTGGQVTPADDTTTPTATTG